VPWKSSWNQRLFFDSELNVMPSSGSSTGWPQRPPERLAAGSEAFTPDNQGFALIFDRDSSFNFRIPIICLKPRKLKGGE
jgi:hypothetical protein